MTPLPSYLETASPWSRLLPHKVRLTQGRLDDVRRFCVSVVKDTHFGPGITSRSGRTGTRVGAVRFSTGRLRRLATPRPRLGVYVRGRTGLTTGLWGYRQGPLSIVSRYFLTPPEVWSSSTTLFPVLVIPPPTPPTPTRSGHRDPSVLRRPLSS